MQLGIVNSYDYVTQTAEVTSFDGAHIYHNCTALMQSCDPANGAYDSNPPAIGAPCIITEIDGENVILGYYSPPTLSGDDNPPTTGESTYVDRSRGGYPNRDVLPGEKVMRTASGGEILFGDMLFSMKVSPALYMVLNMLGNALTMRGDRLQLSAPGADIVVKVNDDQTTDVTINARKKASEEGLTSALEIKIGNEADIYNVKVYGKQFLHVDKDRNVTMEMKTLTIKGEKADLTQCDEVLLPL